MIIDIHHAYNLIYTRLLCNHLPYINHNKNLPYATTLQQNESTSSSFLVTCDLGWKSRSFKLEPTWRALLCLASYRVSKESVCKGHNAGQCYRYIYHKKSNTQIIHNHIHLTYRSSLNSSHLIINVTNVWVTSCHLPTEWLHKLQFSPNPMTLSESQGHSNWNHTVEYLVVS